MHSVLILALVLAACSSDVPRPDLSRQRYQWAAEYWEINAPRQSAIPSYRLIAAASGSRCDALLIHSAQPIDTTDLDEILNSRPYGLLWWVRVYDFRGAAVIADDAVVWSDRLTPEQIDGAVKHPCTDPAAIPAATRRRLETRCCR